MITTKISIAPHLKEYCVGKFNNLEDAPVRFPDNLDVYHRIWDLLEKRPTNAPIDRGNLEIALPKRDIGKSPLVYNYLGQRSHKLIEDKIETMMWTEVHELLETNKHRHSINHLESVHIFVRRYDIKSISEDAFIKNYYRWRNNNRKKEKRGYEKKKNLFRQV